MTAASSIRNILLLLSALLAPTAYAEPTLLVFGDSLSAGYGLAKSDAWPSLLQTRLQHSGYAYTVVNASVSGETTAGGLSRLPLALKIYKPKIVILELGANDGLRGLPLAAMQDNLQAMIKLCQQAGAKVLLVGMRLPPNYGKAYTEKFAASFKDLARLNKTALLPFLFEGFADKPEAFQSDRLHPTAATQPRILELLWKPLNPLLH